MPNLSSARGAVRPVTAIGLAMSLATGAALTSPAMAQDDTAPMSAPTSTSTSTSASVGDSAFSGPWIAAVGGYDVTRAGSNFDNAAYDQQRRKNAGVVYGGAIGFDHDFGRVVLGVEAEGTGSTADRDYAANPLNPGYGLTRVTAGRDIYGGVRAGFKLSPTLLAYGKFGYTNAAYNLSTSNGTTALKDRVHAQGYRAGAGLEYALSRNLFVKTEYRFSDYGRTNYDLPSSSTVNLDAVRHQVVGSVGLRF